MLTDDQLRKIMPHTSAAKRREVLPIVNNTAVVYNIDNERRMAAWLATLAVESGEFKYQEEIASGAAYEGRKDLGNTQKGDGRRMKGHGRIQITGRFNHQAYTNYLKKKQHLPFIDFTEEPAKLAQEPYATDSAGWFWAIYKKLNPVADRGDFLTTQIRVNGRNKKTGLPNHWTVRNGYFIKALSVLPDDFSLSAAGDPADSTVSQPAAVNSGTFIEPDENPLQSPPPSLDQSVAPAPVGEVTRTVSETKETPQGERTIESTVTTTVGDSPETPPSSWLSVEDWKPFVARWLKRVWGVASGITLPGGLGLGFAALSDPPRWFIYVAIAVVVLIVVLGIGLVVSLVLVGIWHFNRQEISNAKLQVGQSIADPNLKNVGLIVERK